MVKNRKTNNSTGEPMGRATAALDGGIQWDVEEDHLLSYFLGGDGGGDNMAATDVAVETNPNHGDVNISADQSDIRPSSEPNSSVALGQLANGHVNGLENTASFDNTSSSPGGAQRRSSSGNTIKTPAVQFFDGASAVDSVPSLNGFNSFVNASRQQRGHSTSSGSIPKVPSRADTTSSSSSSLSSMAAALALGGGGGQNQVLYNIQSHLQPHLPSATVQQNNTSPLTPLNMMESPNGQEMMMLPPPPRHPSSNNESKSTSPPQYMQQMSQPLLGQQHWSQQQTSYNSQQHIEWIQQMNAAVNAAQNQNAQEDQQPQRQQIHHTSYPTPALVPSDVCPSSPPQPQNIVHFQHPQSRQQQIKIGLDGATIPITAAINEVIRPESNEKEDPEVLAEKRQRRLARNRESARQSRRRKKERLAHLGEKVNRLQRQLETEIRLKIASMETGLNEQRLSMLQRLNGQKEGHDEKELATALNSTGANCPIRRAVVVHQYSCLRQAFLSTRNQYSVWLMMQSAEYFALASHEDQRQATKGSKSTSGCRANSKQIGEEIASKERNNEKTLTSDANDPSRMWPLLCHELTMTMDQEDRIINQAHDQAKQTPNLYTKLQRIEMATSATHQLRNTTSCLSRFSSQKNDSLLLDILTPTQAVRFLEWFSLNKERCNAAMEHKYPSNDKPDNGNALNNVSKQLKNVFVE
eukprot:g9892.t1 g9892   contig4:813687-816042(-)